MGPRIFIFLLLVCCAVHIYADKPCAARHVGDEAIVCVCNATYCDEITRDAPQNGYYVAYTSSKGGLRFQKQTDELTPCTDFLDTMFSKTTIKLDPDSKSPRKIGGAATDATGIQWVGLPEAQRKLLIDSYFSCKGLEYNMLRVPIGGSDFSTHTYSYNELPENDTELTNYTLSYEDTNYKIPFIKAASKVSTSPMLVFGSTWSPPPWMKTNNKYTGPSRLKPEYFKIYALYHSKFIDLYENEGVPIWGITTTNEPTDGLSKVAPINDLGWDVDDMGKWIANDLGPMIREKHGNVKIMASDDQRSTLTVWFELVTATCPKAAQYIDGVATHWYLDKETPPQILQQVSSAFPDKFLISTEACSGFKDNKVDLGSWSRGVDYIQDIIEDLTNNVTGWIDWNLCLDTHGGPNWAKNYVDSPIIVDVKVGEFYKQPMFYALGHFSKFIPRGSQIIDANHAIPDLKVVACITPNKTVVVVIYNPLSIERQVALTLADQQAILDLESDSFTTVELPYSN